MKKLLQFMNNIGWFGGEAVINIKLKSSFEGYYGKASELWETQYEVETNEIRLDSNQILLPKIKIMSKRWEDFDLFCERVFNEIQKQIEATK